eukprot:134446-Pleurochrysis_carterae.AAC.4
MRSENVKSAEAWHKAKASTPCHGMGQGELHSRAAIEGALRLEDESDAAIADEYARICKIDAAD